MYGRLGEWGAGGLGCVCVCVWWWYCMEEIKYYSGSKICLDDLNEVGKQNGRTCKYNGVSFTTNSWTYHNIRLQLIKEVCKIFAHFGASCVVRSKIFLLFVPSLKVWGKKTFVHLLFSCQATYRHIYGLLKETGEPWRTPHRSPDLHRDGNRSSGWDVKLGRLDFPCCATYSNLTVYFRSSSTLYYTTTDEFWEMDEWLHLCWHLVWMLPSTDDMLCIGFALRIIDSPWIKTISCYFSLTKLTFDLCMFSLHHVRDER